MSARDFDVCSSEEDQLVIDAPPVPPKKRATKRRFGGETAAAARPSTSTSFMAVGFSNPPMLISYNDKGEKIFTPLSKSSTVTQAVMPTDWQRGMEVISKFSIPLKVDTSDLTFLPDVASVECFKKLCQAWLNEKRRHVPLTFTSHKTFVAVMARFLNSFVINYANLASHSWNVTGASIWRHQCLVPKAELKCFHGQPMIRREQMLELDVASEAGQRALRESPETAKIITNRFNRNVVQIKNEDAVCCVQDVKCNAGSFGSHSCGLFYSESRKAMQAFEQAAAFLEACYPKMPKSRTHLLIPVKCECNYISDAPLLGRQICKVTPFALTAAKGTDETLLSDPKLLASVRHPSVLVYQCCNPVYRSSKAASQKNCDFKISAPDMVSAVQLAKKMWLDIMDKPPNVLVPEFKWMAGLEFQNSILPTAFDDADDELF